MSELIQIPYNAYLYGRPVLLHLFLTDEKGEPSIFFSNDRKKVYANQVEGVKCLWNEHKVKFANLVNDLAVLGLFSIKKVEYGGKKLTVKGVFPLNGHTLDNLYCTEDNLYANTSLKMLDLERLLAAVKNAQNN